MKVFDLHCDSLYKANEEKGFLINNNYEFSFEKAEKYDGYTQTTAIWIPDEYRGDSAWNLVESCYKVFMRDISKSNFVQLANFNDAERNPYNLILSVEGGSAIGGKLENIKKLREMGVRFFTLTWNGSNEIGDGILCENPKGLTEFGRDVINELEKNNIVIDVSHASEPLFWEVAELSKKPFVATHSNSRRYCSNKRNLTDEQFTFIAKNGGVVGLNFHKYFITDNGIAQFSDLERHFYHFLSLGGENTVALGSDFDGAEMPNCIKGVESMADIYEYLLSRNYNETLVKKLFYDNAKDFVLNIDK